MSPGVKGAKPIVKGEEAHRMGKARGRGNRNGEHTTPERQRSARKALGAGSRRRWGAHSLPQQDRVTGRTAGAATLDR